MKRKRYLQILVLVFALAFTAGSSVQAQSQTTPPNPPDSHGATGNQTGGSAPIGGGLFILLGLGAAYGGKKLYDHRKEALEE